MLITECQPEAIEILSRVYGYPPTMARYTLDTAHTPAYAAGYIFSRTRPRVGVISPALSPTLTLTERATPSPDAPLRPTPSSALARSRSRAFRGAQRR